MQGGRLRRDGGERPRGRDHPVPPVAAISAAGGRQWGTTRSSFGHPRADGGSIIVPPVDLVAMINAACGARPLPRPIRMQRAREPPGQVRTASRS